MGSHKQHSNKTPKIFWSNHSQPTKILQKRLSFFFIPHTKKESFLSVLNQGWTMWRQHWSHVPQGVLYKRQHLSWSLVTRGRVRTPICTTGAGVGASAPPYYKCMFGKGKSVWIGLLLGLWCLSKPDMDGRVRRIVNTAGILV